MSTKIRRSLFIGLGGTGMTTLLNTKKMFIDTYGIVPPMIGFMGIDTDTGQYSRQLTANNGQPVMLTPSEQCRITVNNAMPIYQMNTSRFDWVPSSNVAALTNMKIGAGAVRSNGRFAVTNNRKALTDALTGAFNDVTSAYNTVDPRWELLSNDTDIHLVFSLAGGTGSGTFINVAYLLKKLFPNSKVIGYAIGAEVFRAMGSGPRFARVRPNAYGALVDLDYLMHLTGQEAPIKIKYLNPADDQEENVRPFNAFYYVDNRNANGDTFDRVDTMAEMLSAALVLSTGELSVAANSISDNVAKLIDEGTMDVDKVNGRPIKQIKKGWAGGLGVCEIIYDGKRLAEIYAYKSESRLIDRLIAPPAGLDHQMLANQWIDQMQIRENLGRDDVINYMLKAQPAAPFSGVSDETNPHPEVQIYLNGPAVEKTEKTTERMEALTKKVEEGLNELVAKNLGNEGGVNLIGHILSDLQAQIRLCDGEMKTEIESLQNTQAAKQAALTTAENELAEYMHKTFRFKKDDKVDDLNSAVSAVAITAREIMRRQLARQFYNWLDVKVADMVKSIDTLRDTLKAVRAEADNRVQELQMQIRENAFFQIDLAVRTATEVTFNDQEMVMSNLNASLAPNKGLYGMRSASTKEMNEALMAFVHTLPTYKAMRLRTIDMVLDELSQTQVDDVIREALRKSMPLFTYDFAGIGEKDLDKSFFVGVADKNNKPPKLEEALLKLLGNTKATNRQDVPLGMTDRIIIYQQVGVVPAFTLSTMVTARSDYEQYEQTHPTGSHWDVPLCQRMAQERFSIMPDDHEDDSLQWWVKALVFGLIRNNDGKIQIQSRTLGSAVHRYWYTLGTVANRLGAYDDFSKHINDLRPEIRQALEEMDTPANRQSLEQARANAKADYYANVSLCTIPNNEIDHYPDDMRQLEAEIAEVEKL